RETRDERRREEMVLPGAAPVVEQAQDGKNVKFAQPADALVGPPPVPRPLPEHRLPEGAHSQARYPFEAIEARAVARALDLINGAGPDPDVAALGSSPELDAASGSRPHARRDRSQRGRRPHARRDRSQRDRHAALWRAPVSASASASACPTTWSML